MTTTATARAAPARPAPHPVDGDPRRWLSLTVVLVGTFMMMLDTTIVNVALVPIQQELHAHYSTIEWTVSGYALTYGLLLIPSGRLGDRFGRKRLFIIGMTGFCLASALCGSIDSESGLVIARILQGTFAGIMAPQITATIRVSFGSAERGRALGVYGGVMGTATALGPVIGGLVIDANLGGYTWRPIFWLNVPIAVAGVGTALVVLRESRGRPGGLDPVGILLVTAALAAVIYPLIEGRNTGWPPWTYCCMAAGIVLFVAFVRWETYWAGRGGTPVVDMQLFSNRPYFGGVGIGCVYFASLTSMFLPLSVWLQSGLGRTSLQTGLCVLPFSVGSFIGAANSDRLARRLGRGVLHLALFAIGTGLAAGVTAIHQAGPGLPMAGASLSQPGTGWADLLLVTLFVAGAGSGVFLASNTKFVLDRVPTCAAGTASGILATAQQAGSAFGIAVIGVVLFGTLGAHANTSADQVVPRLNAALAAQGVPAVQRQEAEIAFVRCFHDRTNATDPTAMPRSCQAASRYTAAKAPLGDAVRAARRHDFTYAVQIAILCNISAVVITYLLVFLLPHRRQG
jgi:EmrB/QacA subfamily drug resistance transporter